MPRTSASSLHPTLRGIDQLATILGDTSHAQKIKSKKNKDLHNISEKQNKKLRSQRAAEKAREKRKYYRYLLESNLLPMKDTVSSLKLQIELSRNETNLMRSRITELIELSNHGKKHV